MVCRSVISVLLLGVFLSSGCQEARPGEAQASGAADAGQPPEAVAEKPAEPAAAEVKVGDYAWLTGLTTEVEPLSARFAPPKGFKRVSVQAGGFGEWLRGLPVRKDRDAVHAFTGNPIEAPAAAVVLLDIGDRDLQQCADMVIRMHAEYLWARDDKENIAYHFTSGDESAWKSWQLGERFKVSGNKVTRRRGGVRMGNYGEFRRYLDHTFRYAGTRSLGKDSDPVSPLAMLMAGDFFVQPGGPGHAVILLDVATDEAGSFVALIGQGFMPAQDFHVVKGEGSGVLDGVWFVLPKEGGSLDTPSWKPFSRAEARRFRHVF